MFLASSGASVFHEAVEEMNPPAADDEELAVRPVGLERAFLEGEARGKNQGREQSGDHDPHIRT
jgi:hypothetical protein